MTTETMTIHRALVELKTIDSRIIKKIDSAKFCVAAKAKATKLGAITVDEFKTSAQASYDSAKDVRIFPFNIWVCIIFFFYPKFHLCASP